jgi:hypothetical protein
MILTQHTTLSFFNVIYKSTCYMNDCKYLLLCDLVQKFNLQILGTFYKVHRDKDSLNTLLNFLNFNQFSSSELTSVFSFFLDYLLY